jgi:branched-chain amino acid transport system permease protein
MLPYIVAGLALGSIYALAASGLVATYVSTGVLNFAFASMAYFVARVYYFLHSQDGGHGWFGAGPHWGILPAALFSIAAVGPFMGIFLYLALFRFLRLASQLIKVVVTIGVSVVIPQLAVLMFDNIEIARSPGLAPEPVSVYKVLGVAVTLDQVITRTAA